jgi:general secretion pathway protein K
MLTLLITQLTGVGRSDVKLAENLRGAAVAEATADGLIHETAFHLLDRGDPSFADGRPHAAAVADGQATVQIDNEAGKVNLNSASPALIRAVLHQLGADPRVADELAGAIVEWRFPAATAGLKNERYRAAGLSYAPPSAPFENLDELGLVIGMTPDLMRQLRPLVTVLTDNEPDPQVACPQVLAAIAEATGTQQIAAGRPAPLRTVTITARVTTVSGSQFIRRAAVRLAANRKERLLTILTWGAVSE